MTTQITLTLSDTPDGRVDIQSDFKPMVGQRCSPAQAAALEIINRTHKDWDLKPRKTPVAVEVDIDRIHRQRDNVVPAGGKR